MIWPRRQPRKPRTGKHNIGLVAVALLAAATVSGCPGKRQPPARDAAWFRDVAENAGVRFLHRTGQKKAATILQADGSGCAFWDYDGDGNLDVYLINAQHEGGAANALYHNDGNGKFTDVTARAGVGGRGFGMGCAVGDYDGDGLIDLYVCNYGKNELFRNRGDGTFDEVAQQAGVTAGGWSTGAAFFDADHDGDLDLYVGRYAKFGAGYPELCGNVGVQGSCAPHTYPSEPDLFYENVGHGKFREATRRFGFTDPNGRCQGVLVFDYDKDGWPDVFVANDTTNDYLFHNRRGHFEDVAVRVGIAYGADGRGTATMGIDAGDYDNDGHWDLLTGNFQREMDTLARWKDGVFEPAALSSGLGEPTMQHLTFGIGFFDFDNDGYLDIAQVEGHVNTLLETVDPDSPLHQPRQLFHNLGNGHFAEVTTQAGPAFTQPALGRGLAFGDFDNDGRLDLLVNENNGRAALLHNETPHAGHWLELRLVGPPMNRTALGARVDVLAGKLRMMREVRSAASFISVNDSRCHFGLGAAAGAQVTVNWPDGKRSQLNVAAADRVVTVEYPRGG